ncbi:MAG: hypothetical protein H6668_23320 [Ardenticatenaceae bacterium]|nr:hypothetical protein [Ardenticatenaceae bacterium]
MKLKKDRRAQAVGVGTHHAHVGNAFGLREGVAREKRPFSSKNGRFFCQLHKAHRVSLVPLPYWNGR